MLRVTGRYQTVSRREQKAGALPDRDCDKKEVDLVLELTGGKIIAIKIKAASSFSTKDFAGLKVLREILGVRFHCGIV